MKYTPRMPEDNVNVSSVSPLREFFTLTAALLAAVVLAYLLLGLAVDLIIPRLSTDVEKRMGEIFVRSFDNGGAETDENLPVQALLDDLQSRCAKLPYRFRVILHEHDTVNAMAFPGGNIVVFSGLLSKVTSENELAFVLAHELGHYAHRDHLRGFGRALVFMTISALVFGPDSGVSKMLGNALSITELSFSRKQETRADEFAVNLLHCAYGHVGGSTDFFEKITRSREPGVFGHFFATHPENLHRMAHIEQFARSKGYETKPLKSLPKIRLRPSGQ